MCVRVQHQPTTWTSFFFDLHILVAVFPAGVWLCARELNDERVFIILYAISAAYFSGVMVLYSHPNPYYLTILLLGAPSQCKALQSYSISII